MRSYVASFKSRQGNDEVLEKIACSHIILGCELIRSHKLSRGRTYQYWGRRPIMKNNSGPAEVVLAIQKEAECLWMREMEDLTVM